MICLLAACNTAVAQDIPNLISQLGSDDYSERERATTQLLRLGPEVEEYIEDINNTDIEIQQRLNIIKTNIQKIKLWAPSYINYTNHTDLKTFANILSEQSRTRILLEATNKQLYIDHNNTLFLQALDELCQNNNLSLTLDHTKDNDYIISDNISNITKRPTAYSGPFRACITSARRVFIDEIDYTNSETATTHTFQLNIDLTWETHLGVMAVHNTTPLKQALTNTNEKLRDTNNTGQSWTVRHNTNNFNSITRILRIDPPSTSASHITCLEIQWGVLLVGNNKILSIPKLQLDTPYIQDDIEVIITNYREKDNHYDIDLEITRNTPVPIIEEILNVENEFILYDQYGEKFRISNNSGRVSEGVAYKKLSFSKNKLKSIPSDLHIIYPTIRDEQFITTIFRDIPLPINRP